MTPETLTFRTLTVLRTARLAAVEGHRVAVVCADERRQAELTAEYRRHYPSGPMPEFTVIRPKVPVNLVP